MRGDNLFEKHWNLGVYSKKTSENGESETPIPLQRGADIWNEKQNAHSEHNQEITEHCYFADVIALVSPRGWDACKSEQRQLYT